MFKLEISKGTKGDYYESILQAIRSMSMIACGGYYEPISDRDAEIAKVLYKITHPEDESQ